jgi:predicted branched-subunit amino acid permease
MRTVTAFVRFWYDFIIGEDWTVAVAVGAALALTALMAHHHVDAWFVLPAVVAGVLGTSVWRATR